MATSRVWRPHPVDGPFRARLDEIGELNQVFSDSFTERYRRDGMVGVRVPFLNSDDLALRDRGCCRRRDALARRARPHRRVQHGASFRHRRLDGAARRANGVSGQRASARRSSTRGVEWLKEQGATRHRTRDDAAHDGQHRLLLAPRAFFPAGSRSRRRSRRRTTTLRRDADLALLAVSATTTRSPSAARSCSGCCRGTTTRARSMLTGELALGDTVLLYAGRRIVGFALAHTAPLVEGRTREELRVLKLVLADESRFDDLVHAHRGFRAAERDTPAGAARFRASSSTPIGAHRAWRPCPMDGSADVARRIRREAAGARDRAVELGDLGPGSPH